MPFCSFCLFVPFYMAGDIHMIRLKDLLSIENIKPETNTHEKGTVWVVQHSGHFGAKNNFGDVRYFSTRDDATAFTHAHTHHPHDVQHPEKKDPIEYKQGYDLRGD
jgi:hypothetical protein